MANRSEFVPSMTPPLSQRARWGRLALLFGSIAALSFAPFPTCPVRIVLRHPCPGCGVTRACVLAARGHFAESIAFHPLALVAAALVVPSAWFVARDVLRHGAPGPLPPLLRAVWTAFFVLLFALWVARFFGYFGGPVPV